MSEELYNSNDYCSLAEENEELKKENAELLADKLYLIGAAMDGGDKYHYAAHDIGYRDMERKVKALEADYVISNRELLILQSRIAELEAFKKIVNDCGFDVVTDAAILEYPERKILTGHGVIYVPVEGE